MDELEKTAQETAAEEQTGDTTAPDAGEDFETLIRGRYKGEFDARVRKILDGRLRGLRQENERLRQEAVRTELLRQREQDEQLRRAMEFAVEQPCGGERRTPPQRQPVGSQGVKRQGTGGDTEEGTGRGEDPLLRLRRDLFRPACVNPPRRTDSTPSSAGGRTESRDPTKGRSHLRRDVEDAVPYEGGQEPCETGRRGRRPLRGGTRTVRNGTSGTPSPTRLVIARSEATRQSVFLF